MNFMEQLEDRVRRAIWGRTRAESLAIASREGEARRRRFLAENADENGCYITLAPEAAASYCETHLRIMPPGTPDSKHLDDIKREIASLLASDD